MSIPCDKWEFVSHSEADTDQLGQLLADVVVPGTVISLVGDLGAGKTRLVRALAVAMGADSREVTSPTFVLIQEYDARLPIFHFDTYRLGSVNEFLELGAEEYLISDGVCLIEWGDRVSEVLPADHLCIRIEAVDSNSRRFVFETAGPKSAQLVAQLMRSSD